MSNYTRIYDRQEPIKTWQWVVTVIVVVALILIGVMVFGEQNQETDQEFCSHIGRYTKVRNLPAVCLKYFQ